MWNCYNYYICGIAIIIIYVEFTCIYSVQHSTKATTFYAFGMDLVYIHVRTYVHVRMMYMYVCDSLKVDFLTTNVYYYTHYRYISMYLTAGISMYVYM